MQGGGDYTSFLATEIANKHLIGWIEQNMILGVSENIQYKIGAKINPYKNNFSSNLVKYTVG